MLLTGDHTLRITDVVLSCLDRRKLLKNAPEIGEAVSWEMGVMRWTTVGNGRWSGDVEEILVLLTRPCVYSQCWELRRYVF